MTPQTTDESFSIEALIDNLETQKETIKLETTSEA
jgi:hypothetical protein